MKLVNMETFYRGVQEESKALNELMVKLIRGEELDYSIENIYHIYSDYYCQYKNLCDNLAGISQGGYKTLVRIQDLLLGMAHNLDILGEAIREDREEEDDLIRNLKETISCKYGIPMDCIKVSVGDIVPESSNKPDVVTKSSNRLDVAPEDIVDLYGEEYRDELNNLHNHIMQFMPCEEVVKAFKGLPRATVMDLDLKGVRRILHGGHDLDFEFIIIALHVAINSQYEVSDINLICKRYRELVNSSRGY